jgi:hypothetical protein
MGFRNRMERPGSTKQFPQWLNINAAVLCDCRKDLLDKSRAMEFACANGFIPPGGKKTNHSDRLHQAFAELVRSTRPCRELMLGAIRSQDHGFIFPAARASEALTETGDRRRWTHLGNVLNRTDIDPQFQGGGADRSGWSLSQFQCSFRLFADIFGQIAVMGPKLVGDSFTTAKSVSGDLNRTQPLGGCSETPDCCSP